MITAMERYCGSSFWDANITWNTRDPDFTECFENTALLWSACGFLWIAAIFNVYFGADPRHTIGEGNAPIWHPGWSRIGILKILNVGFLIGLQVAVLYENLVSSIPTPKSDVYWVTPVISIATHCLSAGLILFHKSRCIHTSGIQCTHWFLLSVVYGLIFRSKYRSYLGHPEEYFHPGVVSILGTIFLLTVLQTFLFCWSDIPKPGEHAHLVEHIDETEREECPMLRASILSYLLFSWCTPLIRKGHRTTLTNADLWKLIPSWRANFAFSKVSMHYGKPRLGEVRSIWRNIVKPLWGAFGGSFTLAVFLKMTGSLISFLPPKMMGYLIDFVEDDAIEEWKGYLWAFALFGNYIVAGLLVEHFYLQMQKVHFDIKSCLSLLIYRKSLVVAHGGRLCRTTGEIVNLMSVDISKIQSLVFCADIILGAPIQLTVGVILLWLELGVAVVPGIGVLCSIIPINWALTSLSSKFRRAEMTAKDERIKIISEVLAGIQAIKLYAWEPSFQSQIREIRAKEIGILKKRAFANCIITFVLNSIPFLVSITAFFTYIYISGGVLDPKKAFTAVSLFTLLTDPIRDFPLAISAIVDSKVSLTRINSFLNAEEFDPNATKFLNPGSAYWDSEDGNKNDPPPAIEIHDGNFAWEDLLTCNWKLSDVNLKVKKGELIAIVGSVASGKSSLLSAILGYLKYSGEVIVRGRTAYASQIPWILNATLRENICFGLPYERKKYDRIIDACCLAPDLEVLQAGDMTEIGEKGINLSTGQKQRVSLARLVYSGADVLLMDDVLSAVDSQVGKHIFDRIIGPQGLLAGKTRVLCTHSLNFLSQVEKVIVMEAGTIVEKGSYTQLLGSKGKFSYLLSKLTQTCNSKEKEDENGSDNAAPIDSPHKDGRLIEKEELKSGDVRLSVYLGYVLAMGYPLTAAFILFFCASEGLSLGRNVVLSKWTQVGAVTNQDNGSWPMRNSSGGSEQSSYAIQYALLGIAQSLFYLFGFGAMYLASLCATTGLHNDMLRRILHAPMHFFNVTPVGRIVNRFSSDVETLDRDLPSQGGSWVCHVFKLCGILVAICYANIYFSVFILPLIIASYIIQRYFVICMQQLQRMTSATLSPIYAQFQETLIGTSTLRAYQAEERFSSLMAEKLDSYLGAICPFMMVKRWLSVRLIVLGSVVVFLPAIFAVIWRSSTNPSLVGFSISSALQFVTILTWLVKVTSSLQYNFVAVERILEYSEVAQEADFETREDDHQSSASTSSSTRMSSGGGGLPTTWPEKGSITFENYETRYRPHLDLVLRRVSCFIDSGEKIGIVGRTGAGKSSLTLALFRIIEGVTGKIVIDGVDISKIGLRDLRGRLTVIPQEPVLFSRSLRLNLDPFGEHGDDKLWEALRLAHLSQFVEEQEEGLEFPVAEGGENLSVGQRQLVCLARAVIRKSSILILDEATASVDSVTDELIQKTIREHFEGCTILNVAHRLNTVLNSNRILVLGGGEILEFDTPKALLADQDSHFYGMAKDAGIVL